MKERLDEAVLFSTEPYGYDQVQVGKYLAKVHLQYQRLYKENERLRKELDLLRYQYEKL